MEALGIVASVIAVFQASDRALSVLSSFNRARHAGQELENLKVSINAVRLVLTGLPNSVCTANTNETCRFCILIRGCDQVLLNMEALLIENHRYSGKIKQTVGTQILRARWLKRRSRIDLLKTELRDSIALLTLHATLNSPTCARLRGNSSKETLAIGKVSNDVVCSAPVTSNLGENAGTAGIMKTHMTNNGKRGYSSTCTSICNCICHHQVQWYIPICQGRLGFLFVKSTGLLLSGSSTRTGYAPRKICFRHETATASILYVSPRWLPYFGVCLSFSNPARPQFGLSFLRLQRPDSEFCMSIRTGDCSRIYQLLASGQGHVADMVCPYGISVLQLAFQSGQRDVCRLLTAQGAEEDPAYSRWSHNDLWDYMLQWAMVPCYLPFSEVMKDYRNFMSPSAEAKALLLDDEFVIPLTQNFTRFHKSIVGLSCECLEDICITVKHEIDEVDSLGRTPLFWAVQQGSLVAVQTLLNAGANPNITDWHGRTPAHIAASHGFSDCLQALAHAGATLDDWDKVGASPLLYASVCNRLATLNLLLDLGVDVDAKNALGETALSYANMAGNIKVAKVLISRGAYVENVDKWGYTPVLDSVLTNFHDGLRIYMTTSASSVATRLKDGQTILHIAARNADVDTMKILHEADLMFLDAELRDASGNTASDYFLRRDRSEDLTSAFNMLMTKAGKAKPEGTSHNALDKV